MLHVKSTPPKRFPVIGVATTFSVSYRSNTVLIEVSTRLGLALPGWQTEIKSKLIFYYEIMGRRPITWKKRYSIFQRWQWKLQGYSQQDLEILAAENLPFELVFSRIGKRVFLEGGPQEGKIGNPSGLWGVKSADF